MSHNQETATGQDEATGLRTFPVHRVLIVDDHRDTVDTEALFLETLGQTVARAYDSESALRVAAQFRPDIVLLDLDMPRMSGVEVGRRLRKIPGLENARIIAHTGFTRSEYVAETHAAGFDDFIIKPVSAAQLGALLRRPLRHLQGGFP